MWPKVQLSDHMVSLSGAASPHPKPICVTGPTQHYSFRINCQVPTRSPFASICYYVWSKGPPQKPPQNNALVPQEIPGV